MDQLETILDLERKHAANRAGIRFEEIQEAQDEAVAGLRGQLRRRAAELNAAKDEIKQLKSELSLALLKADAGARLVGRQAGEIARLQDDLKLAVEQMRVYQAQARLVESGSRRAG
jgi:predicted nuclease with TOPRIM domain